MNATRPEAETEYSTATAADRGGRGAARAAAGLVVTGAIATLAGALLPVQRTLTIARHPVLVGSVAAGPHDDWTLVLLAVAALGLLGLARRAPRPRVAFAAVFVLGLCGLVIALLVDRSGIGATGAARVDGQLLEAQVRAGAGLYAEAVGAVLISLGGLTGALLAAPRLQPANELPTHAQQSPD